MACPALASFSKHRNNVVGRLRTEAGTRSSLLAHLSVGHGGIYSNSRLLVEEKQKLGFRGQLDTNGNTLSPPHSKSILGVSDDCIRNVLHFEQGDSLPHVGILLLDGFFERLSEVCRKPRCFANSLRGLADI